MVVVHGTTMSYARRAAHRCKPGHVQQCGRDIIFVLRARLRERQVFTMLHAAGQGLVPDPDHTPFVL